MVLETTNAGPVKGVAPATPEAGRTAAPHAAIEAFAALTAPSIDDVVEAIVAFAHQQAGTDEFVEARTAFYASHGKFFPDDPFYDARMGYFLDCFAFSRPLANGHAGSTPFELFAAHVEANPQTYCDAARSKLSGLTKRRHSLFVITRLDGETLVAKDLLAGDKVVAKARPQESFRGFAKKDLFQGFIYNDAGVFRLSPGQILHPGRALPVIRKYLRFERKRLEQAGQSMDATAAEILLGRLALVQLRHARHRHVDAKTIYTGDLLPKK
jgi:hypothetical protein